MVKKYTGSIFFTNTYVVANGSEAIVIDPGLNFKERALEIKKEFQVKAVLVTHGHLDHIDGARFFDCPIYVGSSDAEFFSDNQKSLYSWMNMESPYLAMKPDLRLVKDKEIINLAGLEIKVLYTPGHTNGSVCYLIGNELFTGDSLFVYGIPRTDFPTGDERKLRKSQAKLLNLPAETIVYPGHDEAGTIAICKKNQGF